MLTQRTPEAHAWAVKQFKTFTSGGQFFPVSVDKLNVLMPGLGGGAEWGGSAFDPKTGVLYVNANDTAWLVGITPTPVPGSPGEKIYQAQCSVCHGPSRAGSPPEIPALLGIGRLLTDQEVAETVRRGKGRMPAFNSLSDTQMKSLLQFLKTSEPPRGAGETASKSNAPSGSAAKSHKDATAPSDMPYEFMGFLRFLDPDGYPAVQPPWGTLSAIDLNTGKYLWKLPFGEYPELAAKGIKDTGSDNYGGPIVTAGGLLFIGATVFDRKFRAFDSTTGKLLWQATLPFAGLATPATYMVRGKQYVVIASGGGQSSKKPTGGMYIAFALR
jgi:quinoprotein glucose dehydrogenase